MSNEKKKKVNYWYPNGDTPKESEQDKLVAELMIRF